MSLNLTIDCGNSSTKLALWEDAEFISTLTTRQLTAGVLGDFLDGIAVDGAIVSSVSDFDLSVSDFLNSLPCRVLQLNAKTPLPLTIDYDTPTTLGADRIAAAVGALSHAPGRNMLVCDLGTAATFDYLDAEARFRGGVISAGIQMRLDALHRYTARLPRVSAARPREGEYMGRDTASSMTNAASLGLVAELGYYLSTLPEETGVILTGGDIRFIKHLLDRRFPGAIFDPWLVSRGLNSILIYNEAK